MLGDVVHHHAEIPRVLGFLRVCLFGRRQFCDLAHVSPRLLVHGAGHILAQAHAVVRGGTTLLEAVGFLGGLLGMRLERFHSLGVSLFHHHSLRKDQVRSIRT